MSFSNLAAMGKIQKNNIKYLRQVGLININTRVVYSVAWFSDGSGRSRSCTLSLPRLMDFIQGHVRDVMTSLFFPRQ